MNFPGQHIISIDQFDRDAVTRVFDVADQMIPYARRQRITRVLEGAILGNMFFEPSTRTRVSFGSAFNLLGGQVRETVGMDSSSLSKGESLHDTAKVLSGYSDIIVMRHPQAGSVAEFAAASRVPVLNGGDGANEHPTQALLDLYTIRSELAGKGRELAGLRIAMVGDLKHGRTVHSLCRLLQLYKNVKLTLIAPDALQMPERLLENAREAGLSVHTTSAMDEGLREVDIVYQTRLQEERFADPEEARRYRGAFRINQSLYNRLCHPDTVLLHPLPRDSRADANELDNDLNDNPNLAIFRQADNGVLVRMALFALVLDIEKDINKHARDLHWYTPQR